MSSDAVKMFRMLLEGFILKIGKLFAVTQNWQVNEAAPMENPPKDFDLTHTELEPLKICRNWQMNEATLMENPPNDFDLTHTKLEPLKTLRVHLALTFEFATRWERGAFEEQR